jgi:hypothetical protein
MGDVCGVRGQPRGLRPRATATGRDHRDGAEPRGHNDLDTLAPFGAETHHEDFQLESDSDARPDDNHAEHARYHSVAGFGVPDGDGPRRDIRHAFRLGRHIQLNVAASSPSWSRP